MSGSSSGSDSGGKKPPHARKKNNRGQKLGLDDFLKGKGPTEEAIGPTEKAKVLEMGKPTPEKAAATNVAAATSAAATTTAVVTSVAAAASSQSTKVVVASAAKEPATTVAVTAQVASAPEDTAAPAATRQVATATKTGTSAAPRLSEVVRAASSAAPPPVTKKFRPAVSVEKKGAAARATAAAPANVGQAVGKSYAQQVSAGSSKGSYIVIEGSYVTPRQPPADLGKSRPKSAAGLQGLFDTQWQDDRYGMYFEHLRGVTQSAYLRALSLVVPLENIFSFGLVGRGMVEVYTTTIDAATKLMLEGINVGGRHLQPYPVSVKPTRVVFSRVPLRAKPEDLETFLRRFGKIHGKVRAVPLKIGDEGLGRGIFSSSREAHITLNKGCTLPDGFYWSMSGSRYWIEVSTEARCHACHQVGHFVADCPKRSRKVAEATVEGTTAPAAAPETVSSPGAAPVLSEPAPKEVPEEPPKETPPTPAINGATPTREMDVSSDEELTTQIKKSTKRRSKRKLDQEAMPPPAKKGVEVRRVSTEEATPQSPQGTAVASEDAAAVISDTEVVSAAETTCAAQSGYESCGSTASICSQFEVDPDLEEVPRAKLRSLLSQLLYKKSGDRVLTILKRELGDPARILPQLRLLAAQAKKRASYNEVARYERLYNKVSDALEEHRLEQALQ